MNTQYIMRLLKDEMNGLNLANIYHIVDLIGFCFNKQTKNVQDAAEFEYILTTQCFVRAVYHDELLLCSSDIYLQDSHHSTELHDNNDRSYFDEKVLEFLYRFPSSTLCGFEISPYTSDLELKFSNGLIIQINQDTTESDVEMWRVMKKNKLPDIIRTTSGWELTEGYPLSSWSCNRTIHH